MIWTNCEIEHCPVCSISIMAKTVTSASRKFFILSQRYVLTVVLMGLLKNIKDKTEKTVKKAGKEGAKLGKKGVKETKKVAKKTAKATKKTAKKTKKS